MKNSICDKTKLVTKLENFRYNKNFKTQTVTKLENSNSIKNSNCDETQIVISFKNSTGDNSKTKMLIKLKLKL